MHKDLIQTELVGVICIMSKLIKRELIRELISKLTREQGGEGEGEDMSFFSNLKIIMLISAILEYTDQPEGSGKKICSAVSFFLLTVLHASFATYAMFLYAYKECN